MEIICLNVFFYFHLLLGTSESVSPAFPTWASHHLCIHVLPTKLTLLSKPAFPAHAFSSANTVHLGAQAKDLTTIFVPSLFPTSPLEDTSDRSLSSVPLTP